MLRTNDASNLIGNKTTPGKMMVLSDLAGHVTCR